MSARGRWRWRGIRFALVLFLSLARVATPQVGGLDDGLRGFGKPTIAPLSGVAPDQAPVRLSAVVSGASVAPGGSAVIAVIFEFADGWHVWPSDPPVFDGFTPIPTTIELVPPVPGWVDGVGPIQWPQAKQVKVANPAGEGTIETRSYAGRAIAYIPIRVAADAPAGPSTLTIEASFQACDDKRCLAPETVALSVSLEIASGAIAWPASGPNAGEFAGFDPSALRVISAKTKGAPPGDAAPASAGEPFGERVGSSFYGLSLSGLRGFSGAIALALLGALGGFVLNLTPCVLPVIPIKVLTLTKGAGSPRRSLVLAVWMSVGVVAFWVALGVPAAFVSAWTDPSQLFGIWWIPTGIGALIGLMGLGIMGLFAINLPRAVYLVNPEAETPGGSFLFGMMTGVLGLPCFGFVVGALLPAAAVIGPWVTILVFGSLGVGMAFPYLVLAANPKWVEKIPRTGPASELVKQVMGLLMLAASVFFIGTGLIGLVADAPYLGRQLHWWGVALLGVLAGGWLTLRTVQITKGAAPRVVFGLVGLLIAGGGVWWAVASTRAARDDYEKSAIANVDKGSAGVTFVPGAWHPFSDALLDRARAQGKTIVMDFTAEWCLNCKALKAAVLSVPPVKPALSSPDVVMVKVDLTSTKAPGWSKLRALGQTGIPLLAVEGPNLREPWLSNGYTSGQVLEALSRARAAPGQG